MGQYSSYYLYQKYEKRGEQDWIPCYPNVYSISGDSEITMPIVEKSSADTACGYVPPTPEAQYRWQTVDGYICDDCDNAKVVIHTDNDTIYIYGSGEVTREEVSAYTSAATDVVITNYATSIGASAFTDFASLEFVRIPSTVTSIGNGAFWGCDALQECQIPYGVTTLGSRVFSTCTSLAYTDLPSTVTSIGDRCFASCFNLRYTSIPPSITSIPEACFLNADGLSDIELPATITSFGERVFEGCNGLYTVTILATTPPTWGSGLFNNCSNLTAIYVPSASVNAYKTASGWSTVASKIYPIS
jgi:hypothetical protein